MFDRIVRRSMEKSFPGLAAYDVRDPGLTVSFDQVDKTVMLLRPLDLLQRILKKHPDQEPIDNHVADDQDLLPCMIPEDLLLEGL